MDLRCGHRKFAELDPEEGILEVKCTSKFCGAEVGVVVIHRFDVTTGELLGTLKFREPPKKKELNSDAHGSELSALRSA
jgi:hypothetical protein